MQEAEKIEQKMYTHLNSYQQKALHDVLVECLNEENQKIILEEMSNLNFVSYKFGIAGGFSSLKSINETIFALSLL